MTDEELLKKIEAEELSVIKRLNELHGEIERLNELQRILAVRRCNITGESVDILSLNECDTSMYARLLTLENDDTVDTPRHTDKSWGGA